MLGRCAFEDRDRDGDRAIEDRGVGIERCVHARERDDRLCCHVAGQWDGARSV